MVQFNNYTICSLLVINIIGIILIFIFDSRAIEIRTLSENNPLNLRGSKLKLKINRGIKAIKNNSSYTYNFGDEIIIPKRKSKLRKLMEDTVLTPTFCFNCFCVICCITLLCSFCVDEDPDDGCCEGNSNTETKETTYEENHHYKQGQTFSLNPHHHGHHHHHYHHHPPPHRRPLFSGFLGRHRESEENNDDANKNAGIFIVFLLILIVFTIAFVYLIPRECGKTVSRFFALITLCSLYSLMILISSINIYHGTSKINEIIILIISIILLVSNFIGILIPCLINKCRKSNYAVNNNSVGTPLYPQ